MADNQAISAGLAEYIRKAAHEPLPAAVAEQGRLHLLDTLAAMVSGRTLPAGRAIIPFTRGAGGPQGVSVLATDILTGPAQAAMANGMLAHADETDDSHAPSLTHPGCAIVPAALAAAEWLARDGAALVRAVVLGYDVGTRMSMALGGSKFADTYHMSSHAWGGAFGATAAASALARLSHDQVVCALSYAVQSASGNRCWLRDPDHVQKAFIFGGMPARTGVEAASFAAAGFTGVGDAIEGTPGLLAAFPLTADPTRLMDGLGSRFEVMRTSFKKWCVGSPLQAALDCIEEAVRELKLAEPEVESIVVSLPEQRSRVAQSDMPDVNLPHALALYLVDGSVGFASLHDHARMAHPEIRRVAQRIRVEPRPGAKRGEQAHFTLRTRDGRRFFRAPEHVRGQPGNPMSSAEVADKARDLFSLVLGETRASELVDMVLSIESITDVRDLRCLWRRA
ncbi:MmgE/PrpD family protein [Chelativorans salis]|uniref:MmgE/PrpD family protein n=1 Tax=Chelativorans salis TaxID=2978478 RepID=A0ABT2LQR6_9HYPH|nr:MmgE/PrpD family protein [Chelativorans sp. EGI FJ00035]MCT7376779.1 MmgE/PrpD family protein [Chelativorans sp. EGI FJ00035]